MSVNITEFQDALERGEMAAKNSEFAVADELLRKAEQMNPSSPRVLKARGAVLLAQLKHQVSHLQRLFVDRERSERERQEKAIADARASWVAELRAGRREFDFDRVEAAEAQLQRRRKNARDGVRRPAGRERHHHGDRFGWITLRGCEARQNRSEHRGEQQPFHCNNP